MLLFCLEYVVVCFLQCFVWGSFFGEKYDFDGEGNWWCVFGVLEEVVFDFFGVFVCLFGVELWGYDQEFVVIEVEEVICWMEGVVEFVGGLCQVFVVDFVVEFFVDVFEMVDVDVDERSFWEFEQNLFQSLLIFEFGEWVDIGLLVQFFVGVLQFLIQLIELI